MNEALTSAVETLTNKLLDSVLDRFEDDPEVVAAISTVARVVGERFSASEDRSQLAPVATPMAVTARAVVEDPPSAVETVPPPDVVPVASAVERLREGLGSGGAEPEPETDDSPPVPRWPLIPDEELIEIEKRCRVKERASRWCIERSEILAEGGDHATDVAPRDRDLLADADEDDCRPWMIFEEPTCSPSRIADYEMLETCYGVLADALSVVRSANAAMKSADPDADPEAHRDLFRRSLHLLAEAQSGLRVAVGHIAELKDDEQNSTFFWLRRTTDENRIFVDRYMRANDPADPSNHEDLVRRLQELEEEIHLRSSSKKVRRKRIGNLRHACKTLKEDESADTERWLGKIIALVDELVDEGDHPSNREIRELLLPIEDRLPGLDEVPENVAQVFRELDKYLSTRPAPVAQKAPEPTEEILRVRELLRGRSVMLIGGQRRRQQAEALKEAFELRDLVWESTREHQSNDFFQPSIQREDVAVVLLMIRWSSHSFGDVKKFCDAEGKPLVRLKAGYHPNQVAVQILEQCSEQLEQLQPV